MSVVQWHLAVQYITCTLTTPGCRLWQEWNIAPLCLGSAEFMDIAGLAKRWQNKAEYCPAGLSWRHGGERMAHPSIQHDYGALPQDLWHLPEHFDVWQIWPCGVACYCPKYKECPYNGHALLITPVHTTPVWWEQYLVQGVPQLCKCVHIHVCVIYYVFIQHVIIYCTI